MRMSVNSAMLGNVVFPKGIYTVVVTGTKDFSSADKGNLCTRLIMTSQSAGPDEKNSMIGKSINDNLVFTPEALWKVNQYYSKATGEDIPEGEWTDEELRSKVNATLMGKTFTIEVTHQEYPANSGKFRHQVDKIL